VRITETVHFNQFITLLFAGVFWLLLFFIQVESHSSWFSLSMLISLLMLQWQNIWVALVFAVICFALKQIAIKQNSSLAKNMYDWLIPALIFIIGLYAIVDQATYGFFHNHLPYWRISELNETSYFYSSIISFISPTVLFNLTLLLLICSLMSPMTTSYNVIALLWNNQPLKKLVQFGIPVLFGCLIVVHIVSAQFFNLNDLASKRSQNAFSYILSHSLQSQKVAEFDLPIEQDLYSLRYGQARLTPENEAKLALATRQIQQLVKPNIVLIVLESVGNADLFPKGVLDKHITPNLDELYQHSIIFNDLTLNRATSEIENISILTGGEISTRVSTPEIIKQPFSGVLLPIEIKKQGYNTGLFSASNLKFRNLLSLFKQAEFDHIDYFDPKLPQHNITEFNSWGGMTES